MEVGRFSFRTMGKAGPIISKFLALSVTVFYGVDIFVRIARERMRDMPTQRIVRQRILSAKYIEKPPLTDYQVITDRNIFQSIEASSEKINAAYIETLESTSLKVALLGTVAGNRQNAFAII